MTAHLPASWHAPLAHPAWQACRQGLTSAEVLPTATRRLLLWSLLDLGWTVPEVAEHCRLTEYTVCRVAELVVAP